MDNAVYRQLYFFFYKDKLKNDVGRQHCEQ